MNQEFINQLIRVYNTLSLIDVRGENSIHMAESLILIKEVISGLEMMNQIPAASPIDNNEVEE